MATSYPGGLDNFTNPTSSSNLASPSHSAQHSNANDAIEAIEAELGINPKGSAASVKARLDVSDAKFTDMNEPTGWVNRTDTSLSYNAGTRTVTLTAGASGAKFYSGSVPFSLTNNQVLTVQHDATTGIHFIYFDGSTTLQKSMVPWNIAGTGVPVCVVYYNADTADGVMIEERHGITMDGRTHQYLHETVGTQLVSGFAMSGYNLIPTAPVDSDNDFTVATGIIDDEDIRHTVSQLTGGTNAYRIWSRSGLNGPWIWTTTSHPFVVDGGTGFPTYNSISGSTWSQTPLTTGQYMNMWVVATAALTANHGIIIVMGQQVYSTSVSAQQETWDDLVLGTTPPWTEFCPLYRVTIGVSSGYASTGKARIEAVADGQTALVSPVTESQIVTGQVLYFDNLISDLTLPSVTGTFSAINSNPDTITRTSGSFVTDGFVAGQKISMSGWANTGNNSIFTVAIVAANTLTLITADAITAETNRAGVTISVVRERLSRTPTTIAEVDETVVVSTADGLVTLDTYLAPTLGVTDIPVGPWNFHGWAYASAASTVSIRFQVIKTDTAGNATTLFTTNPTLITATTLNGAQEIQQTYVIPTAITLLTTDRIGIRVIFSSASNSRTAHFIYGGAARASHIETTLLAAGVSLPSGGTSSPMQYISKRSSSDYDVQWRTPIIGDISGLDTALAGKVGSSTITTIWTGTAAQYAALGAYDSATLYVVT